MILFTISDASQVSEVRRGAVAIATRAGFDEEDSGRVALVATELATNISRHAQRGEILVGLFSDASGDGVELIAIDQGPGIRNIGNAMEDGFSTAGSSGHGLGAIKRLSDDFSVLSIVQIGTAVSTRLRARHSGTGNPRAPWAGIDAPKPGEESCGDSWAAFADANRQDRTDIIMVADGLGHGPEAAIASTEAARLFSANLGASPTEILEIIHDGIRHTRGAAVSIARFDYERRVVVFAGIGNVAGVLLSGGQAKRMVCHNGTVGLNARRIQAFEYPFIGTPTVVLHSDGLSNSWVVDRYPGLLTAPPTMIAATLFRDNKRDRDDMTIVVGSGAP
ncbi:ATP-binding protein [Lacibacterium aquatile]|uniref:ATP-binding protein n=1 Tax=Lacibacterium aquatile TaxID=1168082 RepID=A0ABW5DPL2_9PROT